MRVVVVGSPTDTVDAALRRSFELIPRQSSKTDGLLIFPPMPSAEDSLDRALAASVGPGWAALAEYSGSSAVWVIDEQRIDQGASVNAAVCSAACVRLVTASAATLGQFGRRVNAVLVASSTLGQANDHVSGMVGAVEFFLSAASYATGAVLRVDGGSGAGVLAY